MAGRDVLFSGGAYWDSVIILLVEYVGLSAVLTRENVVIREGKSCSYRATEREVGSYVPALQAHRDG